MEEIDYLEKFGENNWYTSSKRSFVINWLKNKFPKKARILNIGVGAGFLTKEIASLGYDVISIDIDAKAINYSKKKKLSNLLLASVESLPFKKRIFDLVIMLDVLEHVKNDRGALKQVLRVIKRGGFLFISVPAGKKLTYHDKRLGHFRRYTKKGLTNKLINCGFKTKIRFWNSILYPLMLFYRHFLGSSKKHDLEVSGVINKLLKKILSLEKYLVLPYGLTLFAMAEKL